MFPDFPPTISLHLLIHPCYLSSSPSYSLWNLSLPEAPLRFFLLSLCSGPQPFQMLHRSHPALHTSVELSRIKPRKTHTSTRTISTTPLCFRLFGFSNSRLARRDLINALIIQRFHSLLCFFHPYKSWPLKPRGIRSPMLTCPYFHAWVFPLASRVTHTCSVIALHSLSIGIFNKLKAYREAKSLSSYYQFQKLQSILHFIK